MRRLASCALGRSQRAPAPPKWSGFAPFAPKWSTGFPQMDGENRRILRVWRNGAAPAAPLVCAGAGARWWYYLTLHFSILSIRGKESDDKQLLLREFLGFRQVEQTLQRREKWSLVAICEALIRFAAPSAAYSQGLRAHLHTSDAITAALQAGGVVESLRASTPENRIPSHRKIFLWRSGIPGAGL